MTGGGARALGRDGGENAHAPCVREGVFKLPRRGSWIARARSARRKFLAVSIRFPMRFIKLFLRPRTKALRWAMVRNYVRKGGWGGSRAGSGNKPGHWEDQGGRATAAETKRDRKEKRTHKTMETKRRMDERWHKWSRKEVRASIYCASVRPRRARRARAASHMRAACPPVQVHMIEPVVTEPPTELPAAAELHAGAEPPATEQPAAESLATERPDSQ